MIRLKHITCILGLTVLFLMPGCKAKDAESGRTDANDRVVCPVLYQKADSLADAVAFIEVPKDRMDASINAVAERGQLASRHQLTFANRLLSLRKTRDVSMFISLLSEGSKKQLDDDERAMVRRYIGQIEDGTFIYGEHDFKFFATFRELTEQDQDELKEHGSFAENPTEAVVYWHFHKPKQMLVGTTFHLITDDNSYKIVVEMPLQRQLPPLPEQHDAAGRKQ